jgi:hypothetical protein
MACLLGNGVNLAEAQNQFGVGYQGIFPGNAGGISARGWLKDKWGWDLTLFHTTATAKLDGIEADTNAFVFDGRLMYAIVVRENSKFYIGGEFGYGNLDMKIDIEYIGAQLESKIFIINPLIGSEFFFTDIPELGFNWEVGYKIISTDIETNVAEVETADIDLDIKGCGIILGVHYYFR